MTQFERLSAVTDAMYLRAQQSLRSTLIREAELRGELKKLDSHAKQVRVDQVATIGRMRAIGADLLWESWLVKSRAQLNLDLAKVLAQKEKNIGKVRKAFGKKTVSSKLADLDTTAKAKALRDAKLTQAIEHSIWRES